MNPHHWIPLLIRAVQQLLSVTKRYVTKRFKWKLSKIACLIFKITNLAASSTLVKHPKLIWVKDRISCDTSITALYLFKLLAASSDCFSGFITLFIADRSVQVTFGKESFRSVYVTYQQLSVPEPDQQTKHFHCRITVTNKINFILAFKRVQVRLTEAMLQRYLVSNWSQIECIMWEKSERTFLQQEKGQKNAQNSYLFSTSVFSQNSTSELETVAEIKVTSVLTVLACGGFKFIFSSVWHYIHPCYSSIKELNSGCVADMLLIKNHSRLCFVWSLRVQYEQKIRI